jgi:spermidine synthase
MLDTLPFYCNCQARLSEQGVLVANLLTRNHGIRGSLERVRAAFAGRALALPKCASGNVVIVAAGGEPIELAGVDLLQRARRLRLETALSLVPTVARLRETLGADGMLRL